MSAIEWQAHQSCGQCGRARAFAKSKDYGYGPACVGCGHVHPMDSAQLGEREMYVFEGGRLAVVSYAASA